MKTVQTIFQSNPEALEIQEVREVVGEYEMVCDQLIDLQQEQEKTKETQLKVLVREIRESVRMELKRDDEAIRFKETPRVDFKQSVENLERYIGNYLRDHFIYL